jgi:hypothetical protein
MLRQRRLVPSRLSFAAIAAKSIVLDSEGMLLKRFDSGSPEGMLAVSGGTSSSP